MNNPLRPPALNDAETRELVRRIAECQVSLYAFIASLVADHNDAEDIRQETNVVVWRKADEGVNVEHFHAWVRKIAYLEVLKSRRRSGQASIPLEADVLEQVARVAIERVDLLDDRRAALRDCLEKLSPSDRRLLGCRYHDGMTLEAASDVLQRPASSVRHSMTRIRRSLRECVDRGVAAGERP